MSSACPECGSPVAPGAAVCPQCGFPLRPGAVPAFGGPARAGQSSKMVFWILGIAALGLIVVVGMGVVFALAIPRYTHAAAAARSEVEARAMLKSAYTQEQAYRAQHGQYAGTLADLREVGWEEPPDTARFGLTVVTWDEGNLCIEAMSRETPIRVMSIQDSGAIEPVGCSLTQAAGNAAGEARAVLQDGWRLLAAYRQTHGALPRDLGEITPQIGDQKAVSRVRLGFARYANGEYCLSVRPRGVVGPERSVDQDGRFFSGSSCAGDIIESFATAPQTDAAAP